MSSLVGKFYADARRDKDGLFGLYSEDLYCKLIGILITAEAGSLQSAWGHLLKLYPALREKSTEWSDEECFKFGYVLLRLQSYGICDGLQAVISIATEVAIQDEGATNWACLIRKECGLPYEAQVTEGVGGGEYIAWKLDLGPRPTTEPWSKVP